MFGVIQGCSPGRSYTEYNYTHIRIFHIHITFISEYFFSITTFETTKYAGILSICPWGRPELLFQCLDIISVTGKAYQLTFIRKRRGQREEEGE